MTDDQHEYCDDCGRHRYNCWCYPAMVNVCECGAPSDAEVHKRDFTVTLDREGAQWLADEAMSQFFRTKDYAWKDLSENLSGQLLDAG